MSWHKSDSIVLPSTAIFVDDIGADLRKYYTTGGISDYNILGITEETSVEWAERLFREYLEYEDDNKA